MNTLDMYVQKLTSAFGGVGSLKTSNFVDDHIRAAPILHPLCEDIKPDISALVYSILRLPPEIVTITQFVLGQSDEVFMQAGFFVNEPGWLPIKTAARRRRMLYNKSTGVCAVYVASKSDVDDIVTILTAFYIEVTKLSRGYSASHESVVSLFSEKDFATLQEALGTTYDAFCALLKHPIDYGIRLLGGTYLDYAKAVQQWWVDLAGIRKTHDVDIYHQPVYFVSSNSHSLMNVLSGYTKKEEAYILETNKERYTKEQPSFIEHEVPHEHVLYYLSRFTEQQSKPFQQQKKAWEEQHGLYRAHPFHHIDIEAQIFSLRDVIKNPFLDARLQLSLEQKQRLHASNALIINIAYPLGLSSYMILKEVSENVSDIRGVYVMGKAGSLNAAVGDISIPHVVVDQHTNNQLFFNNAFTPESFAPYFQGGSILGAQKASTVLGTFLQNEETLGTALSQQLTIIEMEAGPFLNRIYEMLYPKRYPMNETCVIDPSFRLGFAYYISDTPYKKGVNLGSKRLTWEGLNATYAISLGILDDIFQSELSRV